MCSYAVSRSSDASETLRALSVSVLAPVKVKHDVRYVRSSKPATALTVLPAYNPEDRDDSLGGEAFVSASVACEGPHGIKVESVRLVREEGINARVVGCTLDADGGDFVSGTFYI